MKTVKVSLFNGERWDHDWPPESAAEFMEWWRDKINQIPEEYRSKAHIEIQTISDYDGGCSIGIEISYWRPETAEEEEVRSLREQTALAREREKERAVFLELKAKFEGG